MTAWARAGRTAASPSRLARSAPPLRGCGLDRLSPAQQVARKRSRFKVSGTAPLLTKAPKRFLSLPVQGGPWRRHGSFRQDRVSAILEACPTLAHSVMPEPNLALCPTTFISFPVRGRASADRSNPMSRSGAWWTIGPSAFRLRAPRSTYSRRGSAIFSTNYSGHAFEVRRHLP
jgi:hypothetical protein